MCVNYAVVRPFGLFVRVFSISCAGSIIKSRRVEVKKLFLIILVVLFAGLLLLSDTGISIADTGITNNEITGTSNSSASATIVIVMT